MNIQELAKLVQSYFEMKQRDNGETFYCLKDDRPNWLQDLCRDAHAGMLPDGHKYRFVVYSLDLISSHETLEDAENSIEPDIYSHDLVAWLQSNIIRQDYANKAVREGIADVSSNFDIFHLLSIGQHLEINEVFNSVAQSLEAHLETAKE